MAIRLSDLPLGVQLEVRGSEEYKRKMAEAERATAKYEKEIKDLERQFPKVAQASKQLETQTKKSAQAAKQAAQTTKEAGQAAQKSAGMFGQLKSQLVSVAAGFTAMAVGRQVIMMIGDAIEVTKQYEQSNFNLQTQMKAAEREFGLFAGQAGDTKQAVMELADEFRVFSDRDVATAQARLIQMTKRLGFTEEQMGVMLQRTADLSAAQGIDLASGVERVAAAMRGEAESAEFLGLTLNDSWVATKTLGHGIDENYNKMTNLEKAQVRYLEFLEQTNDVQGTAADSTETLAGAQGELNKEWERSQIAIGEIFVPGLRDATVALGDLLELMRTAQTMKMPDWMTGLAFGMPGIPGTGMAARMGAAWAQQQFGPQGQPEGGFGADFGRPGGQFQAAEAPWIPAPGPSIWGEGGASVQQAQADREAQLLEDSIDELQRYADGRALVEEKIARSNEDFWRRMGDQQETAELRSAQKQETFDLQKAQAREDLEREIGNKIAQGFATQADQDWWVEQRMIDFEREEQQAQAKLDLQGEQEAERRALAETQAIEAQELKVAQMQGENEAVEAVVTEGLESKKTVVETKEGEITEVIDDQFDDRETDFETHLGNQMRHLQDHYEKMKAFIEANPLPTFGGAGSGAGGTTSGTGGDTGAGIGGSGGFFGGGPAGQFGLSGVYGGSSTLVVGEGSRPGVSRPEYVRVTPMGAGGGSQQFIRNYNQRTTMNLGTRSAEDAGAIAARVQSENARAARLAGDFGG